MSSLDERLGVLEADLARTPPRINAYDDLPFAMLQYDPAQDAETEVRMREEMTRLARRLDGAGKRVACLSLGPFLWKAIEAARGLDALFAHEEKTSFFDAHEVVAGWLSDPARFPLPEKVAAAINAIAPRPDIVFLYRASVFGPALAAMSTLVKGLHRKVTIPTVLFYPGTREGEWNLRFQGVAERELPSSYHVRIY